MKRTRARQNLLPVRLTAGCMALFLAGLSTAAGWAPSLEAAIKMAKDQHKPIFVDFTTSWCGVCKQMDRTVMAEPSIIGRLDNNFIKVKVDGDARPDLCTRYGVAAYPTFVYLDPQGNIVDKRIGQMRQQEMASALDGTFQQVASQNASRNAVAQANAAREREASARETEKQKLEENRREIASANGKAPIAPATMQNNLLRAPGSSRETSREVSATNSRLESARETTTERGNAPATVASVYDLGENPNSGRTRGNSGESSRLKDLANATAHPSSAKDIDKATETAKAEAARKEKEELAKAEAKAKADAAEAEKKKAEIAAAKKAQEDKAKAEAEAEKAKAEKPEPLVMKAPATIAKSDLPAVPAQSNLAISGAELPKPLLARPVESTSLTPSPAVVSVANNNQVLDTIRKMQSTDSAATAKTPMTVASAQPVSSNVSRTVALSNDKPAVATEAGPDTSKTNTTTEKSKEASPDTTAANLTEKTKTGASKNDLIRWLNDADSKLVSERRKEARAMYEKVVNNDPENLSGKTDMAFVKMISLIVDKDSDSQRREAYTRIKQFEARYPESKNKDYYTLIRSILAVDLGETNEAHRLLGNFAQRFPDSKYLEKAHKVWKELPPVKKEEKTASKSSSSSSKSDSSSKNSSSKSSASSRKSEKSSASSSKSSSKKTSNKS